MKKVIISVLVILVLFIGVVLVWLGTQNGTIKVTKSIEIKANPQKVFAIISNFQTWNDWSPWMTIDPDATNEIEGLGTKPGDVLKWNGSLIGSGYITHLEFDNPKAIRQTVNFVKPFKSSSDINFQLEPTSDGVSVVWTMKSQMPFFMRFMTDQMTTLIELDFERGLKMLKDLAETDKVNSKVVLKGVEKFDGIAFVGKTVECTKEIMSPMMQNTIYEVSNLLIANSTFPEEALSIYNQYGSESDSCKFTSGYRLNNTHKYFPFPDLIIDSIPKCSIMKVTFYGDYKHLGNAWTAGYTYMQHNNLKQSESIAPFEIYLNDPAFFPNPADWVTEVCIPLKK